MAGRWKNLSQAAKDRFFQSIQAQQKLHNLEEQNEKALYEINVEYFKLEAVSNIWVS